jgi:hypothetical protein
MTLVAPLNGQQIILNALITDPMLIRLYVNNKTPAAGDVIGDYTEMNGGGYQEQSLSFENWVPTISTPSKIVYNDFVRFTFLGTPGAPYNIIYGYYIVSVSGITGTALLEAERFTTSFIPVLNGWIDIQPRLALANS